MAVHKESGQYHETPLWQLPGFLVRDRCVQLTPANPHNLSDAVFLPSCKKFLAWYHVTHTIDDLSIHFDGIPWWDGIVLQQVFFCFSWAHLHNLNRVKCSHLSFLERENEVKCLHSLMIIMNWFLGQHNPSNYFALTIQPYRVRWGLFKMLDASFRVNSCPSSLINSVYLL